jgi:hypothetical protein
MTATHTVSGWSLFQRFAHTYVQAVSVADQDLMDSALHNVLRMFHTDQSNGRPLAISMNALTDTRQMSRHHMSSEMKENILFERFTDDDSDACADHLVHTYRVNGLDKLHRGSGTMDFLQELSLDAWHRAFKDIYQNTTRSMTIVTVPSLYRINCQEGVSSNVDIPLLMRAEYGDAAGPMSKQYALLAVTAHVLNDQHLLPLFTSEIAISFETVMERQSMATAEQT